ncbi:MAG: recombinase family protein, partial [Methanosphaera sp. rholeuAM74]
DEGISGMMMKKREVFNTMIADALAGKIDLIITKSVSRFARNTVDSLTTIRKLKEKGVEVYFEKENIFTFDAKGELLLTLMSSLAQEESRSLSQNITWGQRKRFSDGKVSMPYRNFLGYRKGPDGTPVIVPEEAAVVRRIYREYMQGKSLHAIAKGLTEDGVKTPSGKDVWKSCTLLSMLTNEKYKGDALLQKTFTTDYLTKKMKVNEGEVPQYYVTGSHPWIIPPKEWDMVQVEMERREKAPTRSASIFSGKIICAECGCIYGSKVWHSNDKYRKVVWQCNNKYKGKKCATPALNEDDIKKWFVEALGRHLKDRDSVIANMSHFKKTCLDPTKLEKELDDTRQDLIVTESALRQCITDNAAASITEEEYRQRYDTLYDQFQALETKRDAIAEKLSAMKIETVSVDELITCLEAVDEMSLEFDPVLWRITVEKVLVGSDETIRFIMAGGKEYSFRIY